MAPFVTIVGFSVFFAAIPIGLFLAILVWAGLEGRAPLKRVGYAVLWGAGGGVGLGLLWATGLGQPLGVLLGREERLLVESVFTVPLAEELAKAIVFLLLLRNRRIVTALLGLLYGVAAGLGFAMTENFAYFLHTWLAQGDGSWFATVILRTFFSGVMHAAATGAWGAAIGYAATHPSPRAARAIPYLGLAAAMALHGGWNLAFTLTGVTGEPLPAGMGLVSVPVVVAVMIGLAWATVQNESSMIRRELLAEEEVGVLPAHHHKILSRPDLRRHGGWLPAGVDRGRYVASALKLANALRYARALGQDPDGALSKEVAVLRDRVREILAGGETPSPPSASSPAAGGAPAS